MSFIPVVGMPDRLRTLLAHARPTAAPPGWYKISNADGGDTGTATLMIYDDIGGFEGLLAADFAQALASVTADKILLRLNSPGGAVDQGIAIANLIRSHAAHVTVSVDGMAASIASVIAMAGDEVVMQPQSQLMIHEAFGLCLGDKHDMSKMAEVLTAQDVNIARVYANRAGGRYDTWLNRMAAETWYTAEEAVAAGLADRVAAYPRRQEEDQPAEPDMEPEPEPAEEEGESEEGPPEDDEQARPTRKPAANWDLSIYRYAGREKAPAPDTATPTASAIPPTETENAAAGTTSPGDALAAILTAETAPPDGPAVAGAAPADVAPLVEAFGRYLDREAGSLAGMIGPEIRAGIRDGLADAGFGFGVFDTAVGPHECAAREGTWSKGENEGRLPTPVPLAAARNFYAAYDADRVEDGAIPKEAGHLPHHFVSGDGTPGAASISGVHAALGRLNQTHGLSDADRATVERHLRGHLAAGGSEDRAAGPPAAHTGVTQAPEPDGWASAVAHLATPADDWAAATAHLKGA